MSIEDLPDELLVEIFERVPGAHEMYNISRRFSAIVTDIKQRVYDNPEKYIEELSDHVSFLLHDSKYHKAIWDKAVIKGNIYLIIELNKLGYKFDVNEELAKSSYNGHKDLVDFFISKGATELEWGMAYAAKGGHKDLVEFFIVIGAKNWEGGMRFAAQGGHRELVDFFIAKGAKVWNKGMEFAAKGGHKDLVEFFIAKGANYLDGGMIGAIRGGQKHLFDFFIAKGAQQSNLQWFEEETEALTGGKWIW